jgi:hypothetical protein
MAEDSGPAQAFNERLESTLPQAVRDFARTYRHACAADDACARVLGSARHAAAHIERVETTRAGVRGVFHAREQDGHTPQDDATQERTLARDWSRVAAQVESDALDIYSTVKRYAK